MRRWVIATVALAGCGGSAPPVATAPEVPVVVVGAPVSSARRTVKSTAYAIEVRIPKPAKPLSNEPAAVADRMASALDGVARDEERARQEERRRRDAEFKESMKRTRDAFGSGLGVMGGYPGGGTGLGLGGLGTRGRGGGGGAVVGAGSGGLGGLGLSAKPRGKPAAVPAPSTPKPPANPPSKP